MQKKIFFFFFYYYWKILKLIDKELKKKSLDWREIVIKKLDVNWKLMKFFKFLVFNIKFEKKKSMNKRILIRKVAVLIWIFIFVRSTEQRSQILAFNKIKRLLVFYKENEIIQDFNIKLEKKNNL